MAERKAKKPAARKPAKAKDAPPSPPDLVAVREQIDGIDREIQSLIAERALWAHQVGKAKGKLAAAVDYYRPEREAQVLRRVVDRNEGPLADDVLVRLFREIMSACLAQQEPLKVGYLGPEGTFSQQALQKHFGHSAKGLPLASVEEVFDEVAAGHADFGVVPVENSGQGTIQSTLDLFLTSPLKICGEVELRIRQHLMGTMGSLARIARVCSHPQSLAQCREWLEEHLPGIEQVPVSSNAEGARRARDEDGSAAIAGDTAAEVYGLKILAMQIEDRAGLGYEALNDATKAFIAKAQAAPQLAGLFSSYQVNVPQLYADIDRTRARQLSVPVTSVFDTMQIYLGSLYVNDFNKFGRTYSVRVQADAKFRARAEIGRLALFERL